MYNKTEILEKLKKASYNYYNNKESELSDLEYDSLMNFAHKKGWITEDSILNDNAEINLTSDNISHDVPMLSLKKAKTELDIKKYYDNCILNGAKTFIVEPKLDGIALNLKIRENKIVSLSSRGNGYVGENLSYLLTNNNLEIKNINNIYTNDFEEIRGELVCSNDDFLFNNKYRNENEKYKNQRNAVSGIVTKAKLGLEHKTRLTFIPYFGIKNKKLTLLDDSIKFTSSSIFTDNIANNYNDLINIIKRAKNWLNNISYPTDGIVIKPIEEIRIGETNHHPQEYIAFKYPSIQKETKVIDIIYSVGKTGKITPTVKTEPVVLSGVEINSFTGNNYDWLKNKNISIGSIILVTRANDVIPHIISVVDNSNSELLEIPKNCKYCNSNLKGDLISLSCQNKNCSSIISYKIGDIVGKGILDINGFATEVVQSLSNVKNVADIINLDYETLKNLTFLSGVSLGEKRAKLIYNQIQERKKGTEEYKWLASLDIPNLGPSKAKMITEKVSIIELFEDINNSINILKNIKGIGEEFINGFSENFINNKKILENLLISGVEIKHKEISKQDEEVIYIVHTGKVPKDFRNRKELEIYLSQYNYKLSKSINKNTFCLLTEDKNSSSSKMKNAIKNNVSIYTFKEFKERFLKQ